MDESDQPEQRPATAIKWYEPVGQVVWISLGIIFGTRYIASKEYIWAALAFLIIVGGCFQLAVVIWRGIKKQRSDGHVAVYEWKKILVVFGVVLASALLVLAVLSVLAIKGLIG
jgi:hypothetical protein